MVLVRPLLGSVVRNALCTRRLRMPCLSLALCSSGIPQDSPLQGRSMWLGIDSPAAFGAGGRVGQCQGRSLGSIPPQHLELAVGHGRVWSGLSLGPCLRLLWRLLTVLGRPSSQLTHPTFRASRSTLRNPGFSRSFRSHALQHRVYRPSCSLLACPMLAHHWLRPSLALPWSASPSAPPKRSHQQSPLGLAYTRQSVFVMIAAAAEPPASPALYGSAWLGRHPMTTLRMRGTG